MNPCLWADMNITPSRWQDLEKQWHPTQYPVGKSHGTEAGSWKAAVHGLVKSWTQLSTSLLFHFQGTGEGNGNSTLKLLRSSELGGRQTLVAAIYSRQSRTREHVLGLAWRLAVSSN